MGEQDGKGFCRVDDGLGGGWSDDDVMLVSALDPEGVPRAWAKGPMRSIARVRALAHEELAKYREAKRETGDPLGEATYTFKTERVEEAE